MLSKKHSDLPPLAFFCLRMCKHLIQLAESKANAPYLKYMQDSLEIEADQDPDHSDPGGSLEVSWQVPIWEADRAACPV